MQLDARHPLNSDDQLADAKDQRSLTKVLLHNPTIPSMPMLNDEDKVECGQNYDVRLAAGNQTFSKRALFLFLFSD